MIRVNRPVVREMGETDYRTRQPFVLRLEVGGRLVKIKTKGSRKWYTVTLKQIWMLGAANRAAEIKAEKKARREARSQQGDRR